MSVDSQRAYSRDNGTYEAKMRAGTELENLIRTGKFLRHENAKHPRAGNTGGFDRYSVEFILDGVPFEGQMVVALSDKGAMFYDIVSVKEKGATQLNRSKPERVESPLSTNNIHQKEESVNRSEKKSSKSDAKKRYALSESDEQLLFDEQFYEQFANEDRSPIKETIEELEKIKKSDEFDAMSFEDAYVINTKLRALRAGYDSLYDYFVGEEKARLINAMSIRQGRGNIPGRCSFSMRSELLVKSRNV